jgi:carbamoyltransferase
MLVLGWHGGVRVGEADDQAVGYSTHDGAAVLVRDGEIIAAIEEERLSRVKHSNFFPARSIRFCLDHAGVTMSDIDLIAFDAQESVVDEFAAFCALVSPEEPLISGREMIARVFEREFGLDLRSKLHFCKHHLAHIYSAIYASGQECGLAVALDGEGDQRSGMVATFSGGAIVPVVEYSPAQSLGAFYTSSIALLGYRRFDEYKVMGLAPYGDAERYRALFDRFYTLLPDGQFEIVPDGTKLSLIAQQGLLPQIRRKGQPFMQLHKDLAASIQDALERIAMHIFEFQARATGERSLCYAGGVAHNCTLNGKLLYSGLFDALFVQPVAHDAGNALGAALAAGAAEGMVPRPRKMPHLYLGSDIGSERQIAERLEAWEGLVTHVRSDEIAEQTADLLAGGAVIGWVQGRSEFGPRALGNRSILADARPARFKHVINAMVKKREGYRPFAPSVIEERLHDFFDVPESCTSLPFMIFVVRVRDEMREVLGAVTHVDGTARVQSVSRDTNPRYHALIEAFGRRTGVPVLLNTSFNNDAEPIVDSIDEAVACFLTTGIQYLVVGDYMVRKSAQFNPDALRRLVPKLRLHQKLVRRSRADTQHSGEFEHAIESTASSFFVQSRCSISEDVFMLLLEEGSIDARCRAAGITGSGRLEGIMNELVDLWSRRALVLQPV